MPSLIASTLPGLNVTYRCPKDVVYALRTFYKSFYTHNDVLKSMSIVRSGLIPKIEGALYMTFTRAEKQALLPYISTVPGAKLYTITEAQGLTFDHVVVVREQVNDIEIYRNQNQAVTAISRHRKTLVYYTRASDDALSKLMSEAISNYSTPEIIETNNRLSMPSEVRSTDLKSIMRGLNLRVGALSLISPLQSSVQTDAFSTAFGNHLRTPAFLPFLGSLTRWAGAAGSLCFLAYYRGPLTSWRLGNVNASPPLTPSALLPLVTRPFRRHLLPLCASIVVSTVLYEIPLGTFIDSVRAQLARLVQPLSRVSERLRTVARMVAVEGEFAPAADPPAEKPAPITAA